MSVIEESVHLLEERIQGSGCEDGAVYLNVHPDCTKCPYEHGVCMVATFGGKSAEFITSDPTRVTTKLSFMFGARFESPRLRAAACVIVNAVTGFLCLNRVLHSCQPECHNACLNELKGKINGRKVHLIGYSSRLEKELSPLLVDRIEDAEVVLVNGDGLESDEGARLLKSEYIGRELLFTGPSTSGVAILGKISHWCPYGR
ncbi:MAG: hypothetical protein MUF37_08060 [Methanoregulaceae archaeon]|jgi:hypothetical protein|nr:hypothetical protein [Methanoregulaceae archaeon]